MCAGSAFCSYFVFSAIVFFTALAATGFAIGFIFVWAWLHDKAQRSLVAAFGLVAWLGLGVCLMVGCMASIVVHGA